MDGIVPDFALRSDVFPSGNYGADIEFRSHGLSIQPKSANRFRVREEGAIDLAVRILTAYAPGKLAGSGAPIQRTDAPRVKDGPTQLDWLPNHLLKGAFVNVAKGGKAPSVAFGSLALAEKEAERIAREAPGTAVLTLRIESGCKAVVTTTIEKV
jgi:hypothetical protein